MNYGVWAIEYWCDIIRAAIIGQLFVGHNPLGTSVIRVAARSQITVGLREAGIVFCVIPIFNLF